MQDGNPPPFRLTTLTGIITLQRSPPSIQQLTFLTQGAEEYPWFRSLVHQYLPLEAEAILSHPNRLKQFAQFLSAFEQQYFPLSRFIFLDPELQDFDIGAPPPWSILKDGIPYEFLGISYEDLHDLSWDIRTPALPTIALLCNLDDHWALDDGIRPSWMEAASEILPTDLLKQIPKNGIAPALIHHAVAHTPYHPISIAVSWLFSDTGNFILDTYFDGENYSGFEDPWDPHIVAEASAEWDRATRSLDTLKTFLEWMNSDFQSNFTQTLHFILDRLPDTPGHPSGDQTI